MNGFTEAALRSLYAASPTPSIDGIHPGMARVTPPPTFEWSDRMIRLVSFSLVVLAIVSLASMSYAQCGSFGGNRPLSPRYGGQSAAYGGGFRSQRYYPAHSQGCFGPTSSYSAPQPFSGAYDDGRNNFSAPQGSGSRGYAPAPVYQLQPTFQAGPRYSMPQGSGARNTPSQGSGLR